MVFRWFLKRTNGPIRTSIFTTVNSSPWGPSLQLFFDAQTTQLEDFLFSLELNRTNNWRGAFCKVFGSETDTNGGRLLHGSIIPFDNLFVCSPGARHGPRQQSTTDLFSPSTLIQLIHPTWICLIMKHFRSLPPTGSCWSFRSLQLWRVSFKTNEVVDLTLSIYWSMI